MDIKETILNIILPQFCLGCQKEGRVVCEDCLALIDVCEFVYCPFCPKPERVFKKGKCKKHSNKFLNGLYFAADYQSELIKTMVWQFKYEPFLKILAPHLAFLIITHFVKTKNNPFLQNGENSFLIPVPLSKKKKSERGYNQSEVLSQELSLAFKTALLKNTLCKIKKTASQVGLSFEERQENVKGAFLAKHSQTIKGKTIFLVDDVFTTGSTMEECSRVLKLAGAKAVWGIAIAREPLT